MRAVEKPGLAGIRRFVAASEEIQFESRSREQVYGWVERVLIEQQQGRQGKVARRLVRRHVI